jgi:hypothetical protein
MDLSHCKDWRARESFALPTPADPSAMGFNAFDKSRAASKASLVRLPGGRFHTVARRDPEAVSIAGGEMCLITEATDEGDLTDIDPSAEISRSVNQETMRLLQSHLHEFAAKRCIVELKNLLQISHRNPMDPGCESGVK